MDYQKEVGLLLDGFPDGAAVVELGSGNIVYAEGPLFRRLGTVPGSVLPWLVRSCPPLQEAPLGWEVCEPTEKRMYEVRSRRIDRAGSAYGVHLLKDISDYLRLNRETVDYLLLFRDLSRFQTSLMEKIHFTYYEILPLIAEHLGSRAAFFLVSRDAGSELVVYDTVAEQFRICRTGPLALCASFDDLPEELKTFVADCPGGTGLNCLPLCCGEVSGWRYTVFLTDPSQPIELSAHMLRLYVENSLFRERLEYENEHDRLTGLYNKRKFMTMREAYIQADEVCVIYLDVNDLKLINDRQGHEAGDRLLQKAAKSIHLVTGPDVHGYRIGGDEFLMIARNHSEEEICTLLLRWEQGLAELNQDPDGVACVIAAGTAFGSGSDFDDLLQCSDDNMYARKRLLKNGRAIR